MPYYIYQYTILWQQNYSIFIALKLYVILHLTKIVVKICEPKGNPGVLIGPEGPSRKRGRNVGEVSIKYSKELAVPAMKIKSYE